jgi:Mn2+/Fe2+ NRAMP family transporter
MQPDELWYYRIGQYQSSPPRQTSFPLRTVRMSINKKNWLTAFGPGILMAATGVGAGDLLTPSFAGSQVGLVIVWAAVIGAALKLVLNEGIARWQMATGTTLLEGWNARLGPWFSWIFLLYFIIWSFAVGGALVSACGVAGDAVLPLGDNGTSRIIWGIIHSLVSGVMAWRGGFKRFGQVMSVCIALMFIGVIATATLLVIENPSGVLSGVFTPRLPATSADWRLFLGVLGGVGGTVTMLSYGYWIREAGRKGREGLRASRIDLIACYALTGLFGVAMVMIGSRLHNLGQGARVAVQLADQLSDTISPFAKFLFLVGFWGAVFTSILGVWQGVPYLFADFWRIRRGERQQNVHAVELRHSAPYRWYLLGITFIPLVWLWLPVKQIQLAYATIGAWFMPLLALTLLIMNNRVQWVGESFRSRLLLNAGLIVTVLMFVYLAIAGISE